LRDDLYLEKEVIVAAGSEDRKPSTLTVSIVSHTVGIGFSIQWYYLE
jgi:hypothetical protein